MPLYIADYLADTSRLTTEQHGAYLLLLMDYWRNGAPPDDENVLAAITKLSVASWRKAAGALSAFFDIENGLWVQSRIESELKKANGISDKRKQAGAEGAAKRWGKTDGKPIANAMANGMANASQSASQIDTPSPSPIQRDKTTPPPVGGPPRGSGAKPAKAPGPLPSKPDDVCAEAWDGWIAHRKRKKGEVTQRVIDTLRTSGKAAGMTLEQAMDWSVQQGHQGFYPPAQDRRQQGPAPGSYAERRENQLIGAAILTGTYRPTGPEKAITDDFLTLEHDDGKAS